MKRRLQPKRGYTLHLLSPLHSDGEGGAFAKGSQADRIFLGKGVGLESMVSVVVCGRKGQSHWGLKRFGARPMRALRRFPICEGWIPGFTLKPS